MGEGVGDLPGPGCGHLDDQHEPVGVLLRWDVVVSPERRRGAEVVRQPRLEVGEVNRSHALDAPRFGAHHDVGRAAEGPGRRLRVAVGEAEDGPGQDELAVSGAEVERGLPLQPVALVLGLGGVDRSDEFGKPGRGQGCRGVDVDHGRDFVVRRPAGSVLVGARSRRTGPEDTACRSRFASLSSAALRLILRPSTSPSQLFCSASAIRSVRLAMMSRNRSAWAGSGQRRAQRTQACSWWQLVP